MTTTQTEWGKIMRAALLWVVLSLVIFILTPRALKLVALGGIAGLWVIYGARAVGSYTRQMKIKRGRVVVGADGEVFPANDITPNKPLHLRGRGSSASSAYTLAPGVYRLGYRFPGETPVCVEFINLLNSQKQPLLDKSGSGSLTFTVEQGGRYAFQVTPGDDQIDWGIDVAPLE